MENLTSVLMDRISKSKFKTLFFMQLFLISVLLLVPMMAAPPTPAWPGEGDWILLDTDPFDLSKCLSKDVNATYYYLEGGYLYLRMHTLNQPVFYESNSCGTSLYKWFLDFNGDAYISGSQTINDYEYALIATDRDPGGIGVYLLNNDTSAQANKSLDGASLITNLSIADFTITGNNIDMYVSLSYLGTSSIQSVWWLTDDNSQNIPQQSASQHKNDYSNYGGGGDIPFIPIPHITITKTASVATAISGDTVTFTLDVINDGQGNLTPITVIDELPTGLSFVDGSASPVQTSWSGQLVTWVIDFMNNGTSQTITFNAIVDGGASGDLINLANVTAVGEVGGTVVKDTDTATVSVLESDLSLDKTAPALATEDSSITYNLTVSNNGAPTAYNLTLIDTLPAGVTYNHPNYSGICGDVAYDGVNHTITLSFENMTGGEQICYITVTVDGGTANTTLTNEVDLTYVNANGQEQTPPHDLASTDVVYCLNNSDCFYLTDQCNIGVCNVDNVCEQQTANENQSCDDGLYCNVGETCQGGTCTGGGQRDCSDFNDCTADSCIEALIGGHCAHTNESVNTSCGEFRSCPLNNCSGFLALIYPSDGHDYCDGQGTCVEYSCAMIDTYCTDDDDSDGVNTLKCGAECDQDSDCADTCGGDTYNYNGSCSAGCTCSYDTESCNQSNGWYDTGTSDWFTLGPCALIAKKEQEYRDFTCNISNPGCIYSVGDTRWVNISNISYRPPGTVCRPSAGDCDLAETCTGSSVECPTDDKSTAECRASAGDCDIAEYCDGINNDCPGDSFEPGTTECRASAGICDVNEYCTGSSANCPTDTFRLATYVCRASTGQCDVAETCTGSSASCPADVNASDGTSCNDGLFCKVGETCQSGVCTTGTDRDCSTNDLSPIGTCWYSPDDYNLTYDYFAGFTSTCDEDQDKCLTGTITLNHTCDIGTCGADCVSNDNCSTGYYCDDCLCKPIGNCVSDADCAHLNKDCSTGICNTSNNFTCEQIIKPATTVCRASTGDCDVAEYCDGIVATCPTDSFESAETECRASAGICDVNEYCTGSSASCPTDSFESAETECRASAGDCDLAETCTGSGASCPTDSFEPGTTECRASAGDCDLAETCTGSGASCPTDSKSTAVCRAATDACDLAEYCDGVADTCPATDEKAASGTSCGLARDCPDDACAGYFAEFYPDDGHDTCDGDGNCEVYSCAMETSYCTDDDPYDGKNTLECGAPCDSNDDCLATSCGHLNGCYDGTYRSYSDVANTCLGGCTCTTTGCSSYSTSVTDNDGDGYDVECDGDCDDNDPWVYPGAPEICNNVDDDCDGSVDEGLSQSCGSGPCAGTRSCSNGNWGACSTSGQDAGVCAICDSSGNPVYDGTQDLDCSDVTCPGDGCGVGGCGEYIWGSYMEYVANECVAIYVCSDYSCNDYITCEDDNDGDGYSPLCGDCDDNNFKVNPGAEERCNGIDDDCDGVIDENTTISTTCGVSDVGICTFGDEFNYCIDGSYTGWQDCTATFPEDEECNGLDDDCDGEVDENLTLSQQCGVSDVGICTFGVEYSYCLKGNYSGWQECNATFPNEKGEICGNGLDDDCDGEIDEGCGGGGGGSHIVKPGREICNDGIQNMGEEGIDCGGPCPPCPTTTTTTTTTTTPITAPVTIPTTTTTTLPPTTTTTLVAPGIIGAAINTLGTEGLGALFFFLIILPLLFFLWWGRRKHVATPHFLNSLNHEELKKVAEKKNLHVTEGVLGKEKRLKEFVERDKVKVMDLNKEKETGELLEKLKLRFDGETAESIALASQLNARLFAKDETEVKFAEREGLNVLSTL